MSLLFVCNKRRKFRWHQSPDRISWQRFPLVQCFCLAHSGHVVWFIWTEKRRHQHLLYFYVDHVGDLRNVTLGTLPFKCMDGHSVWPYQLINGLYWSPVPTNHRCRHFPGHCIWHRSFYWRHPSKIGPNKVLTLSHSKPLPEPMFTKIWNIVTNSIMFLGRSAHSKLNVTHLFTSPYTVMHVLTGEKLHSSLVVDLALDLP